MRVNTLGLTATVLLLLVSPTWAAIEYDQNVTNNAIFGSGNINGSFTTDRANGIEVGLRGKLRHNALGDPENTFNSNGDGTYSFATGVAPTQSAPTGVWSLEWSINSNYLGTDFGRNLNGYTYLLSIDSDPSQGVSYTSSDPINIIYADHSIGNNSTANGAGAEAPFLDFATYATLIADNNLAQNSWKAHWIVPGYDPTVDGTYDFKLEAFDGGSLLASTEIQIIAGAGGDAVVPEPVSLIVWSLLGAVGVTTASRRRQRAA